MTLRDEKRRKDFMQSKVHSQSYSDQGFLIVDELFKKAEIAAIKQQIPQLLSERGDRIVFETSGAVARSIYGVHQHSALFARLAHHPRLIEAARALLGGDVYVYQSKLNLKSAFDGDTWDWHQDYVFWQKEDAMPAARVLTAAVYLDEVSESNGPLLLIPTSHRDGVLPYLTASEAPRGYEERPSWIGNLTAQLKYATARPVLARLAADHGITAAKGAPGTTLFFHGNTVHASPPNISPLGRSVVLFTYNAVDNAPAVTALHRPDFLVSRDSRPIRCLSDELLAG